MYSSDAILQLANTVGFGEILNLPIELDSQNNTGSSSVVFKNFHRLVTVKNIYKTLDKEISSDSSKVNSELTQIRMDASRAVLVDVIDSYEDVDDSTDYSSVIINKLNLLRKPFGYKVAITSLEMMMSSDRFNLEERNVKQTYATLKIELEGATNDRGIKVSNGIIGKYNKSIRKAQKVIFGKLPCIDGNPVW